MPNRRNSHSRRRARLRPVQHWHQQVREIVEAEAREVQRSGGTPAADPAHVVIEVMALASPHAVTGLDVVVPGTRSDVASQWVRRRLRGEVSTPAEMRDLARAIAPLPDQHLTPYHDKKRNVVRYRSDNKTQDRITERVDEWFRSIGLERPTF